MLQLFLPIALQNEWSSLQNRLPVVVSKLSLRGQEVTVFSSFYILTVRRCSSSRNGSFYDVFTGHWSSRKSNSSRRNGFSLIDCTDAGKSFCMEILTCVLAWDSCGNSSDKQFY